MVCDVQCVYEAIAWQLWEAAAAFGAGVNGAARVVAGAARVVDGLYADALCGDTSAALLCAASVLVVAIVLYAAAAALERRFPTPPAGATPVGRPRVEFVLYDARRRRYGVRADGSPFSVVSDFEDAAEDVALATDTPLGRVHRCDAGDGVDRARAHVTRDTRVPDGTVWVRYGEVALVFRAEVHCRA